ncbi:MAG: hypothetical protein HKN54_01415 [Flavobacteriaceae bacterium]|nr:hypothetical protein [Flavobacteriaceae bacterium]
MKKLCLALAVLMLCFSCQDELQDNLPTFQSIQDGSIFWKATGYGYYSNAADEIIVEGRGAQGVVQLIVPALSVGTYALSTTSIARATLQQDGVFYSTVHNGVGSPAFLSDGEIKVESVSNNVMRGTFKFNAYDNTGQLTVNFIEGVFFNIPNN